MAHLQTDGARVFSLWRNEGMIGFRKRHRDPTQLAKLMIDIASGEVEDHELTPLTKKQAAEIGGKKRATALSSRRRSEIASKAARARWKVKS